MTFTVGIFDHYGLLLLCFSAFSVLLPNPKQTPIPAPPPSTQNPRIFEINFTVGIFDRVIRFYSPSQPSLLVAESPTKPQFQPPNPKTFEMNFTVGIFDRYRLASLSYFSAFSVSCQKPNQQQPNANANPVNPIQPIDSIWKLTVGDLILI